MAVTLKYSNRLSIFKVFRINFSKVLITTFIAFKLILYLLTLILKNISKFYCAKTFICKKYGVITDESIRDKIYNKKYTKLYLMSFSNVKILPNKCMRTTTLLELYFTSIKPIKRIIVRIITFLVILFKVLIIFIFK